MPARRIIWFLVLAAVIAVIYLMFAARQPNTVTEEIRAWAPTLRWCAGQDCDKHS